MPEGPISEESPNVIAYIKEHGVPEAETEEPRVVDRTAHVVNPHHNQVSPTGEITDTSNETPLEVTPVDADTPIGTATEEDFEIPVTRLPDAVEPPLEIKKLPPTK